MKGIIVGVDKQNNENIYRIVIYKYEDGKWEFTKQMLPDKGLVAAVMSGKIELNNAKLDDKKRLVGNTGSLDRFNSTKGRPLVIMSVLLGNGDNTVGYKVADYSGEVKNIKAIDLLEMCKMETNKGNIPIQNGIYVPETGKNGKIRCYPNGDYIKEKMTITKKRQNGIKTEENKIEKNNEKNKNIEVYTDRQKEQIIKTKEQGLNYKLLLNKDFTPTQMAILRETLQDGLNAKLIANPKFTANAMRMYRADLRYKVDIRHYLNPEYNIDQINELSLGYISGVDISKYNDPSITAEEMAERRIRLENKIWVGHKVKKDNSWEQ